VRAQLFIEILVQAVSSEHASQARNQGHGAPSFPTSPANQGTWVTRC
jgi:hypothetical protein